MVAQHLPIDDVIPILVEHLSSAGKVVLKAEPGAGKTTRVPPALLDAGLADLPNKRPGQIVVLQPRRVAARAAAAYMSQERGTALGAEIGYQVRLDSRVSKQTRIVVCTEGVFLRRLQDDPLVEDVAVVVFDEFHERSLDSDLALAMTRLVREQVRPDLRLVVMSATLDSAPIAQYLGGCPIVECPGRTYPVTVEYLQFESNASIDRMTADGIKQILPKTSGHVLAFLPGVGEIRQTQSNVEAFASDFDSVIMPLYGELPLEEQQSVLSPSSKRKIILATNVAETSLTIDGVTAVVDSGFMRTNRFDANVGLNRLELTRISKASAVQRSGRAGRTQAGTCVRLWTERQHQTLADFGSAEIFRVDLSDSMLRLIAWGEHNVREFGWFESPPSAAVDRALALLDQLDAISGASITEIGRQMVALPLQPRLARLLVEGARLKVSERAALCAALLSERSPFRRRDVRIQAQHYSRSDVLDRIYALEDFANSGKRDSEVGELLSGPAKQILRSSDQLHRLVGNGTEAKLTPKESNEAILRAIAIAFLDRACKRRQPKDRRGLMMGGRGVKLADESAVLEDDLFVAVELMEMDKAELSVRQASCVERSWLPESHLSESIDVSYDRGKERVVAVKRTRFGDLEIDSKIAAMPSDVDPGEVLAQAVLANHDLDSLIDEESKDYLSRVQCLGEWCPELELPKVGDNPWKDLVGDWCYGCTSIAEVKAKSAKGVLQGRLTHDQMVTVDREAPERFTLPNGRTAKLQYESGKSPILAARIQDMFGIVETPRIAKSRVPVLIHLLAPNYRVQQITADLAGFWKNTYSEVKKELKGRYPKHAWPDNPLVMPPQEKRTKG